MKFRFMHATRRNTKAYIMYVGELTLCISYETIVAFNCRGRRCRLENHWGPTTRRHMREMSCDNYEIVSDTEFAQRLDRAFADCVRDDVARSLTQEALI